MVQFGSISRILTQFHGPLCFLRLWGSASGASGSPDRFQPKSMRGFFGLGSAASPKAGGEAPEAKASQLLQAAQESLNSLRLQTKADDGFPLLNSASRSVQHLQALVDTAHWQGDMKLVWRRWVRCRRRCRGRCRRRPLPPLDECAAHLAAPEAAFLQCLSHCSQVDELQHELQLATQRVLEQAGPAAGAAPIQPAAVQQQQPQPLPPQQPAAAAAPVAGAGADDDDLFSGLSLAGPAPAAAAEPLQLLPPAAAPSSAAPSSASPPPPAAREASPAAAAATPEGPASAAMLPTMGCGAM